MLPDLAKPEKKSNRGCLIALFIIMGILLAMLSYIVGQSDSPSYALTPAIFAGIFLIAGIFYGPLSRIKIVPEKKKTPSYSVEHVNRIHYRAQTLRFAAIPLALSVLALSMRLFNWDEPTGPDNEHALHGPLIIPLFLSSFLWIGAFYNSIRWIAEIAAISNKSLNKSSQFKLPQDVKIVAWFNIIPGLLSLVMTTCLLSGLYDVASQQRTPQKAYILGFTFDHPFVVMADRLVFGVVMLAIGIGLLQCKKSAWYVLWPVTIYSLISSTVLLFTTPSAAPLIGLLIGIVIIGWLIFRRSLFVGGNCENDQLSS